MSQSHLVVFTPSGKRANLEAGSNQTVLDVARQLGVDIDSVCSGRGKCCRCQIELSVGQFDKHGITSSLESVSSAGVAEARHAERNRLQAPRRLACQVVIHGDLVVDVPSDSQVHRQVICKSAGTRKVALNPVVQPFYVELALASFEDPRGDLDRLIGELVDKHPELPKPVADFAVAKKLQQVLKAGKGKITAIVHNQADSAQIIDVRPDLFDHCYGIAFDIGSTSIAGYLLDLSSGEELCSVSAMNPQIKFGEDVMSRVSYAAMNEGGAAEMTAAVQQAVNQLATEASEQVGIAVTDIYEVTFVGNPVMHHLLLGFDPSSLGVAPFALVGGGAFNEKAAELGFHLNPGARAYILPCIAGHVGADMAAVVLAEAPQRSDEISLLVDIGTNAEIVIGNAERLLAASSPTGPAFEGAQISCGQRASVGAIERVRIDPETLKPRFKVIGCDYWSDAPEFAEATKDISITGICGSGIIEAVSELFTSGLLDEGGRFNGDKARLSARLLKQGRTYSYLLHDGKRQITVSQGDIRAIQLAKGALYAGIKLLMDQLGVKSPDRIVLCGAFGTVIDPYYAVALGLVPECNLNSISAVGNAAGAGASIALINAEARSDIEQLVGRIEKVETATADSFQDYFVKAMGFCHSLELERTLN